jgi:transposase
VSVPTSRAFKETTHRFPTITVDEFRTTKVHHQTLTIMKRVERKCNRKTVRGFLWCDSTRQTMGKHVDRDLNTALNIRLCAMSETRPMAFRRLDLPAIVMHLGRRM